MPVSTGGRWRWRRDRRDAEVSSGHPRSGGRRHRGHRRARFLESESRGGNGRDPPAQCGHVALAVGMQTARQEDDVAAGRGIEPDGRAGESGVTVRADREELAAVRRERRVDVPAEAANARHPIWSRGRSHFGRPSAATGSGVLPSRPSVEQHAREPRQVARGREQPGVPGDAAHAARRRVVNHATERRLVRIVAGPRRHRGAPLGGRDPRTPRGRRIVAGVVHGERLENLALEKLVERRTARAMRRSRRAGRS